MQQPHRVSRSGRPLKPPDWINLEQHRNVELKVASDCLNISNNLSDRDSHEGASNFSSASSSKPASLENSAHDSHLVTPDTSPDTSIMAPPTIPPCPGHRELSRGRTARQRAEDILERHRHWSDPGPGAIPVDHSTRLIYPELAAWDPLLLPASSAQHISN